LSGALYDLGKRLGVDDLLWLVLFGVSALTILGLAWFGKHYGGHLSFNRKAVSPFEE
jgi:hypothetical protein